MFGWTKHRGEVERFNLRNPICAPIFHELVNESSNILGTKLSEQCFEINKVRTEVDGAYAISRAATNKFGLEDSIQNISFQLVRELQGLAVKHGEDEDAQNKGIAGSVPFIRRIVFGFAPGLAALEPSEEVDHSGWLILPRSPEEITYKMIFILTTLFSDQTPNTFPFGVSMICNAFSARCDRLRRFRVEAFLQMLSASNEAAIDADEFPNGVGEFGSISNPIPCGSISASREYLNRLTTTDGIKVAYERRGSVMSDFVSMPVDAYSITLRADPRRMES